MDYEKDKKKEIQMASSGPLGPYSSSRPRLNRRSRTNLSQYKTDEKKKPTKLSEKSIRLGLDIYKQKTQVLKINTSNKESVKINEIQLKEVETFTYLGSIINQKGGTDDDVKAPIGKVKTAIILLKNIWKANNISRQTKIRLFNSNVKSVMLNGSETWRMTRTTIRKIQTFINTCLRRILKIQWP